MKAFRFWLLILLALLLPLRGALAHSLPCAGGSAVHAHPASAPVSHSDGLHQALAPDAGLDAARQADLGAQEAPARASTEGAGAHTSDVHAQATSQAPSHTHAQGQCSACASCCASTPLASLGSLALPTPPAPGLQKFPAWTSPVPGIVLDGLERPPRSA